MPTFTRIFQQIMDAFGVVIEILFYLATAIFLWGLIQYLIVSDDEKKIQQAKTYMIYGIFTLFIMVSAWGIVRVLVNTFGFNIGF